MRLKKLKARKLNQIINYSIIFLLTSTLFNSCNDSDSEIEFDAIGDVLVQKKKVGDEIQFGAFYYMYGNASMTSAKVTTPSSTEITLETSNSGSTFLIIPGASDFSSTNIAEGTYTFSAIYNGETVERTDDFSGVALDLPTIDSAKYNGTQSDMFVWWQTVNGADIYVVKLYDLDGELIYNGPTLDDDAVEFGISPFEGNWAIQPQSGDEFILELHAFSFDSDADDDNWAFNIECNSFSETQLTWQ